MSNHGGRRPGAGRPKAECPLVARTFKATAQDWALFDQMRGDETQANHLRRLLRINTRRVVTMVRQTSHGWVCNIADAATGRTLAQGAGESTCGEAHRRLWLLLQRHGFAGPLAHNVIELAI